MRLVEEDISIKEEQMMSADAVVRRTTLLWRACALAAAAMVLAILTGVSLVGRPAQAADGCTVSASEGTMDADEQAVLSAISAYRQQKGLSPLAASASLSRAAAWKAHDFGVRTFQGSEDPHVDSLGRLPHAMNLCFGFSGTITGENMGAGQPTPQAIVDAWKGSPSHDQNMLRPLFVSAGVGRFNSPQYGVVWFLELGNALDSGAPTVSQPTPAPTPARATATTPPTTLTNVATAIQSGQTGTVTVQVTLVDANGQATSGDLSG